MDSTFKTLFFNEGPGYIYIKALASGVYGSAILVRNVKNLLLYVRKEAMEPSRMGEHYLDELDYHRAPPAGIIDTVRPIGCYVYKHESMDLAYEVTYWPYYDCGTLDHAIIRSRNLQIPFPEILLAKWLRDMLSVILDLHQAGKTHRDGHLNNWFLRYHRNEAIPRVALGDWGRALTRGKHTKEYYDLGSWSDYKFIMHNIEELFSHQEVTTRFLTLYTNLRNAVVRFSRGGNMEEMDAIMRRIRDDADKLRNIAPRPTREQDEYLVVRARTPPEFQDISYDATLHKDFPSLKKYEWALGDTRTRKLNIYSEKIGKEPFHKLYAGGFPRYEMTPRSWTVES